ncbi:MAG: VIT1/CCC1 transporter family protein [Acidimicrobiia bacterium]|nr:VIT1/CCC1 transporter family protein [Acidimicrobiia bacterium]
MQLFVRPGRIGHESIREIVFGVEDGVVQNLTLIAGMVGGGLSTTVIVFAAAINGLAGVLSMSMGTYLSSKAERDVAAADALRPPGVETAPGRDAGVMAAAYALGAVVPIIPFALVERTAAMAGAVMLALLTLFLLGYGKGMVSHQNRTRSGVEMLTLASLAGLAGFALGAIARGVFGLDV